MPEVGVFKASSGLRLFGSSLDLICALHGNIQSVNLKSVLSCFHVVSFRVIFSQSGP